MTPPFVYGRYVRSAIEAEQLVAADSRSSKEWPGDVIAAMRRGSDHALLAARVAVELCRRGYSFPWTECLYIAAADVMKHGTREIVRAIVLSPVELAEIMIDDHRVKPEEDRERKAEEWSAIACDDEHGDEWFDAWQDSKPRERKTRDRRYFGMQNRAMRDKLERGECVDVSTFPRTAAGYYIIPPDVWQDEVDWCDASAEEWIWSAGRQFRTGEIHASQSNELYQNDAYDCLFLR